MPRCRSTSRSDLQTREGPGVKLDFSQPSELKSGGVKAEKREEAGPWHIPARAASDDVTLRANRGRTQETGTKYALGIAVNRQGSGSAAEGNPPSGRGGAAVNVAH